MYARLRLSMLSVLLTASLLGLSAPAAAEDGKLGIAVLTLKSRGLDSEVAENLTEVIARAVDRLGLFRTISTDDIRRMLQHEQNKVMLGCDDTGCLAEIGGALGVELLLSGSVGKIGETYVVNLKLIDVRRAEVLKREERTVSGKIDTLLGVCRELARAVVQPLLRERSGKLAVSCSEEGAEVFIDDRLIGTTPIAAQQVPGGFHQLRVTKSRFVVFAKEVKVQPDQLTGLEVVLIPSKEFIAEYESRATTYRTTAWTMTALSAALAGTAVGLFVWNDDRLDEYNAWKNNPGSDPRPTDPDDINMVDSVSLTLGIVGGVALGTAIYFWIAGDPPGKYDDLAQPEPSAFLLTPSLGKDSAGAQLSFRF